MPRKQKQQLSQEEIADASRTVSTIRTIIVYVLDKLPYIIFPDAVSVRPGMEAAARYLLEHMQDSATGPTMDEIAASLEYTAEDFTFDKADDSLRKLELKMKIAVAGGLAGAQLWFKIHPGLSKELRAKREEFFLKLMANPENPEYPEVFEAYQIVRDKPRLTIFFSDYVLYKLGILSKVELDREHRDKDAMDWRIVYILDRLYEEGGPH